MPSDAKLCAPHDWNEWGGPEGISSSASPGMVLDVMLDYRYRKCGRCGTVEILETLGPRLKAEIRAMLDRRGAFHPEA